MVQVAVQAKAQKLILNVSIEATPQEVHGLRNCVDDLARAGVAHTRSSHGYVLLDALAAAFESILEAKGGARVAK